MQNFKNLFSQNLSLSEKPWLIIGKGQSYSLVNETDLSKYHVLTLNHVIKNHQAKIAHLIDIDVFDNCQTEIDNNADYLVMPYRPHVNSSPGRETLPELIAKKPMLEKLDKEDRLFYYDHLGFARAIKWRVMPYSLQRDIAVTRFSAEAAVGILAKGGVKDIFTVGIDGGTSYNVSFSNDTLLANKRTTFDDQFNNIINVVSKNNINYQALNTRYPIKVYIATQEEQMLAVKVLEYSIKKHTSKPVEIYPLHLSGIDYSEPNNPANRQRTPFSFQRFLIPELNNNEGRAIYLDSDMQVFSDINKLWTLPMGEHDVLTVVPSRLERRRLQFSVMLMDCEKLDWKINDIIELLNNSKLNYESLMYNMSIAKNIGVMIPKEWNCLEWFKKQSSHLVHYTDMNTQPWISTNNSLGHLWVSDLVEAIDNGFINLELIKEHIEQGWIRPSLLFQIEHRVFSSLNLPPHIQELDKTFIPPYQKMQVKLSTPYKNKIDFILGKTNKVLRMLQQRL